MSKGRNGASDTRLPAPLALTPLLGSQVFTLATGSSANTHRTLLCAYMQAPGPPAFGLQLRYTLHSLFSFFFSAFAFFAKTRFGRVQASLQSKRHGEHLVPFSHTLNRPSTSSAAPCPFEMALGFIWSEAPGEAGRRLRCDLAPSCTLESKQEVDIKLTVLS